MNRIIYVLLAILLAGCQVASSTTQSPEDTGEKATVTLVGNAGFLITLGDKKILIDSIFNTEGLALPAEIRDPLFKGEPPFDHIDLILTTHAHEDHFDAEGVVDALNINPEAIFISTTEAANQVLAIDDSLKERIIGISLKSGEEDEQTVNIIRVVAYAISHGIRSDGGTDPNLGFLVEANDVKFFHSGDLGADVVGKDYFARVLGLPAENIDIAIFPHHIFSYPELLPIATEGVAARYYVPCHYESVAPLEDASVIRFFYPDAVLFNHFMETWVMP